MLCRQAGKLGIPNPGASSGQAITIQIHKCKVGKYHIQTFQTDKLIISLVENPKPSPNAMHYILSGLTDEQQLDFGKSLNKVFK